MYSRRFQIIQLDSWVCFVCGKLKASCSFFGFYFFLFFLFERVKEHGRGRWELWAVSWKTAINIRNLFKFNFDFICFLSGAAAVVFTFIRFGSVRFALSHPKIPSIRPSWQPVCLPISRGRPAWQADWLPAYHDYCDYWPRLKEAAAAVPRNLETHKLKTKVKMFSKRRQNQKRKYKVKEKCQRKDTQQQVSTKKTDKTKQKIA